MEENEVQNNVDEGIVPTEQKESHEPESNASPNQVESAQDRNWRAMRERQRELEQNLRYQQEMNEKLLALANRANPVEEIKDELDELADDEFIPKGKVKKLVQKEKESIKREAIEEVKHLLAQQEQAKFMDHLRSKFSDFDDVVNKETLSLLEKNDPELAVSIAQSKDPYQIGVQSYKYIKALGLQSKASDVRKVRDVEKKLEKNTQTVPSPLAYDKRPMAQAFKDTEAERSALYAEMIGCARKSGMSY